MKIGLGHLRMRPDDFWRMSLPEFFAAIDGYLEANGSSEQDSLAPPTQEEVNAMFAAIENRNKL